MDPGRGIFTNSFPPEPHGWREPRYRVRQLRPQDVRPEVTEDQGSTKGHGSLMRAEAARETIASLRSLAIAFPQGHRLRAIIDAYATLVPVDAWAFSYRRSESVIAEFLSGDPHIVPERLGMVRGELSGCHPPVAAVASPAGKTEPYRHGLAVHLDDDRGGRGALLLLRHALTGEFRLDDRSLLTEAREEVLRALTTQANFDGELSDLERARMRSAPGVVLLDQELAVKYASRQRRGRIWALRNLTNGRLPQAIEREVRKIVASWNDPSLCSEQAFMPSSDLIVRVVPLNQGRNFGIALVLEPYEARSPLGIATRRFRLTNRELEVIALLFSGLGTPAIAQRLAISDATVNDHVKRLLQKTSTANRTEMAAKLLGWRGEQKLN